MTKIEKLASMRTYLKNLEARLVGPVPAKRSAYPEAYRDYLRLEITKATKTVDKLAIEVGSGK